MRIKVDVRDIDKYEVFLRELPRGVVKVGLHGLVDWLIGEEGRALRHYEQYKYVKPFRSYSSDPKKAARQRGWIFTHLDQIGHENRSNKTAGGWKFKETNSGYGITLLNEETGATWLWGDAKQTRQNKAVGHRTISSKIQTNILGAIRHARAAVNRWLKGR